MLTTKIFKLRYIIIFILILLQLILNNLIPNKVDIIGTLALIVLINQYTNYTRIFILSIIADLIGPYYIGTHFLGLIMVSFVSKKYYNFYKILTYIQKNIILLFYIILYQLIINLVNLIFSHHFGYLSFVVSSIIILPIIIIIANFIYKTRYSEDDIYL